MPPAYGTLETRPHPRSAAPKRAVLAAVALACVALVAVAHLSTATARTELSEGAVVSQLAAVLAAPGGSATLLKHEKTAHSLKQQLSAAEGQVKEAVEAGESLDEVKILRAKAAEAKKKLQKAQAEAENAEAALVHAAGGDLPAIEQPLFFAKGKAAEGKQQSAPLQKKGFISGDRFGEHHVFNDYGINHKRRRGNWAQRHFGDWINTADGRQQYVCDYRDDPYETGTHRRVSVIDNEWCDDQYYGYHYPVHYHDDREVYNNGYGEHLGTVYGDDGVKPGVMHKMVQDYYGDFFHGQSPGYDWIEEHGRNSEQPAITQYAYSTYKDKTYGDEGDKRQRPLYYMDWDEDGTRALDHTKTFGEEDFMSQGGDFANKPHGKHPLTSQQLLLKKEQAEAHTLEQQVKKQKLDLEVNKLENQVAAAKKSIHTTIVHTVSKEKVQQERVNARHATLKRRHVTKNAQTSVAKAYVQQLSSAAPADDAAQAADILDAAVGDVEASLGFKAKGSNARRAAGVALAPRLEGNGKRLTLSQKRRVLQEKRWAQEQRQEARERQSQYWLKNQLSHGHGLYARRAAEAAAQSRKMRQALSLTQDRNGEMAKVNMGRAHGCYIQQVTGASAMLDDCDPLEEKMQPAIEAARQHLAETTEGNVGGVHWTSGDVPYNYDVFPLREAHGGYSGLSDISFPADSVYPTVYKPTLGLGPGDYAMATGTKARAPAVLHEHSPEEQAAVAAAFKAAKEVQDNSAIVVKEQSKKAKLMSKEQQVEKSLREQHREEAVAATDKAIADKVMADAIKNQDEEQRTRLLKAATDEYTKASAASKAAKVAKAVSKSDTKKDVKTNGVSLTLPAAMAKGSVTISFSGDGGDATAKATKAQDPMDVARKFVQTELQVRAQAKKLAAAENAKTAAMVARTKELNKALSAIVPEIAN